MKKILIILMILTMSVVSVFAVEKSKTFGNCTVYFDTDDADKHYINPKKSALERGLVIFNEVPAYFVRDYIKTGILDSEISKRTGIEKVAGENAFACIKVIIYNNLAGGCIYNTITQEYTYIFKDSEGNLYYAK